MQRQVRLLRAASTAGTYTVTYTMAAAGGCAARQQLTSVTITALPVATFSYTGTPIVRMQRTPVRHLAEVV